MNAGLIAVLYGILTGIRVKLERIFIDFALSKGGI